MADVFISYSREDRERVEPLAEALAKAGYTVWWDKNIAGGSRYAKETEAELTAAKVVLAAWTKTSVDSAWVADEAGAGRDNGRLLPISLDGTMAPLGFRQFQVLDLSQWKPGDDARFAQLRAALDRLIEQFDAKAEPAAEAAPEPTPPAKPGRMLMIGGIAAAGLALIAIVALFAMRPQPEPVSPRVAIFGFTAGDGNTALSEIADSANAEIFQVLSTQGVNIAARTETVGAAANERFARAAALDARFALSGEINSEPGTNRARVSLRMEDVAARTTLWEDSFSEDAGAPLAIAARAAARAGDPLVCFVQRYPLLSKAAPQADWQVSLATYCAGWRGDLTPEARREIRKLAELAPDDPTIQAELGRMLANSLVFATPAERPAQFAETEKALTRAEALDPDNVTAAYVRFLHGLVRQRPLAELQAILETGLQQETKSDVDRNYYQKLNSHAGLLLQRVGRTREALPYMKIAAETDPFNPPAQLDYGLTSAILAAPQAGDFIREAYDRWPSLNYAPGILLAAAVFFDAGDADALLAAPPKSIPAPVVACWRDIHAALKAATTEARAAGADKTNACIKAGYIDLEWALLPLSAFGDLDTAFKLAEQPFFGSLNTEVYGLHAFFVGPTRAMRADPRFLPVMEKWGYMDYWRATKSQPDVCATEAAPFCLALKAAPGSNP